MRWCIAQCKDVADCRWLAGGRLAGWQTVRVLDKRRVGGWEDSSRGLTDLLQPPCLSGAGTSLASQRVPKISESWPGFQPPQSSTPIWNKAELPDRVQGRKIERAVSAVQALRWLAESDPNSASRAAIRCLLLLVAGVVLGGGAFCSPRQPAASSNPDSTATESRMVSDAGGRRVGNLDFEARVPVPFSVFPSSYRESETATQTHVHEEVEIKLPQLAGREGHASSFQEQAHLPPREEGRFKEEVRITRQEEHRRPGIREEFVVREEYRKPKPTYSETRIEYDTKANPVIDAAESEYRSRVQSNYKEPSVVGTTVTTADPPAPRLLTYKEDKASTVVDDYTVDPPAAPARSVYKKTASVVGTTVDPPRPPRLTRHQQVDIVEETVEAPRFETKSKMGYYDEDGNYHSFRAGLHNKLHKLADRIAPHEGSDRVEEVVQTRPKATAKPAHPPNTVTIPCHHIRLGDILILQGRPCQVIRISTSAATGQHRYLGVDLFTKQLHEESSFISNPAPSVVVQTMLGPVFKQYRVLDLQDGRIVAMTETGDVKHNLPVIDQSNLWGRLQKAFESGRGSVRVLVVSDHGREIAVDMKVVHGSRL
ncbi:hypothetical protein VTJ04DRAFT_2655 [Mycothermus thermophilus]|uniref:uncharacterized protein n=1 Tax=Humicola insolens TaxID=85995 RepID=UPI0037428ACD